jgi:hypothetical protein
MWGLVRLRAAAVVGILTLVSTLVSVLLPSTAAQGVDSVGGRFTGTIETTWDYTYTWDSAGYSTRYTGMAKFDGLEPIPGTNDYASNALVGGTTVDQYTWPSPCRGTQSFQYSGHYGPPAQPAGTVWLSAGPEGVLFQPDLLVMEGEYTSTCEGASDATQWGSQGGFAGGESWSAALTADTDPASDRLVGSTTWTLGNPPGGQGKLSTAITDYSFTVTYDLTFTPVVGGCNDRVDNDVDGYADYPGDPGCDSADDPSELGVAECDNGIDDDGDGLVDYRGSGGDPTCQNPLDRESLGCDEPLAGPATIGDSDGDRLPTIYETAILLTDPDSSDTDCDGYGDALEVASGASPLWEQETPANMPRGLVPTALAAKGQVGITCGRTKFKWMSVTLDSLGVGKGAKGCIVLMGNTAANAVLDFALEHDKATVTATLAHFFGDHLGEVHGEKSNDWQAEYQLDRSQTRAKKEARKKIYRAFGLARYNNIFLAGEVAGLNGIAIGSLFGMNQLRNNDACIQVRVGNGTTGIPKLSWSLIYSKDQLTKAGVADNLHRASVYQRKDGFLVDKAVKRVTNLSCTGGRVTAEGSASEVFESAKSFAF